MLQIAVWRYGAADWRWEVHDWINGRPWWVPPLRKGRALTRRGAQRKARRVVRDLKLSESTRTEYEA